MILILNSDTYDYLTSTIVEGLVLNGYDVYGLNSSNYCTGLGHKKFIEKSHQSEFIIVSSSAYKCWYILNEIDNDNFIFLDGEDYAQIKLPKHVEFKAVFKREYYTRLRYFYPDNTYPLQFGAELRYIKHSPKEYIYDVSFIANLDTNQLRGDVDEVLKNLKNEKIFSGTTNERAYSSTATNYINTPEYRKLIHSSKISINVPGGGEDCARYWEILSFNTLLFSYKLSLNIPFSLREEIDFITFKTKRELIKKINYFLNNPGLINKIAESGHRRLLKYHSTHFRARYFMKITTSTLKKSSTVKYTEFIFLNFLANPFFIRILRKFQRIIFKYF
jgi:hypothetical protein